MTKGKIYSEFLTNLAVATISAGIIVPIFTSNVLNLEMISFSFIATIGFVAGAIMAKDIK